MTNLSGEELLTSKERGKIKAFRVAFIGGVKFVDIDCF